MNCVILWSIYATNLWYQSLELGAQVTSTACPHSVFLKSACVDSQGEKKKKEIKLSVVHVSISRISFSDVQWCITNQIIFRELRVCWHWLVMFLWQYKKAINVSSQVRIALVKRRLPHDGLDHYYVFRSAGKDKCREPNLQSNWTDRVHGIFARRWSYHWWSFLFE